MTCEHCKELEAENKKIIEENNLLRKNYNKIISKLNDDNFQFVNLNILKEKVEKFDKDGLLIRFRRGLRPESPLQEVTFMKKQFDLLIDAGYLMPKAEVIKIVEGMGK